MPPGAIIRPLLRNRESVVEQLEKPGVGRVSKERRGSLKNPVSVSLVPSRDRATGGGSHFIKGSPYSDSSLSQKLRAPVKQILPGHFFRDPAPNSPHHPARNNRSNRIFPSKFQPQDVRGKGRHQETQKKSLRPYQKRILQAVGLDLAKAVSWIGVAAPMQTGKSYLIADFIESARKELGPHTKVIVLHYGRVITKQLMKDLTGAFPPSQVGRLDGEKKQIDQITVASIPTMVQSKYLNKFNPQGGPYLLIFDEAIRSHTPSGRKILKHFGLGQVIQEGPAIRFAPKTSSYARVIGLSGTSNGLAGYHLNPKAQLPLLEALEGGWVREMVGERVFPEIESQRMQNGLEKMVWWKPTMANALELAKIYLERIKPKGDKNLVSVPTTQHGELFQRALNQLAPEEISYFIHHKKESGEIQAELSKWQEKGGALISIKMLSYSFRAEGADSIFHTYQTTSPELFATRTGRAWGVKRGKKYQPYYVLEITWDKSERFSNLAKLVGLADYPRDRLIIKQGLKKKVQEIQRRKQREEKLRAQIELGQVEGYFAQVPILESWRRQFAQILKQAGGQKKLALATGLPQEVIRAFALGALPTQRSEVKALSPYFQGEEQALAAWVKAWEQALQELYGGIRRMPVGLAGELIRWQVQGLSIEHRAAALAEILGRAFNREERRYATIDPMGRFWSFVAAVQETKRLGQVKGPTQIADRAHQIYSKFYKEGRIPSQGSFRRAVSGRYKTPEIVQLLERSPVVERRLRIRPQGLFWSFVAAVQETERLGQVKGPTQIADRAHQIYSKFYKEGRSPSQAQFGRAVGGRYQIPKIVHLLERSPAVEKRKQVRVDPEGLFRSFVTAVQEAEGLGQVKTYQQIADRAHQIYSKFYPEGRPPSQGSFRRAVSGRHKTPEIVQLLERSPAVEKRKQVRVDPEGLFLSFVTAVQEAERLGTIKTPSAIADRAHQIYSKFYPEGRPPSQRSFRKPVGGRRKIPEIVEILKRSPAVQSRVQKKKK